jgi:hypothetical protein
MRALWVSSKKREMPEMLNAVIAKMDCCFGFYNGQGAAGRFRPTAQFES